MKANHTVASARVKAGKTQKECAERLSIDLSTYNLKESGKRRWTLKEAFDFCEFVEISIDDIEWFPPLEEK